jgi:uncharacterized protein YgiM (DUF1202 family)
MQSGVLKIIPFLTILLLASCATQAQSLNYHLAKADSLFQQKRYTQSLELYRSIFERKQYTPAMFLKMAYIEEGLDHPATAIYYLNLYYLATHDERVVPKIKDLAAKHGLDGYDFAEAEQWLGKYQEHHTTITFGLASLVIFLMSLTVYQRARKVKPVGTWVVMLVVVIILFVHSNVEPVGTPAIIAKPDTYIMSGPSAGASVVRILDEGHRVEVTGKQDVWLRVRLNNQDVFIKEDNLLVLSL